MGPHSCPTVQIQGEKSEGNPSGIVVINESDFDEATMQRVQEQAEQEPAGDAAKAVAEAQAVADAAKAVADAAAPAKVVAPWAAAK